MTLMVWDMYCFLLAFSFISFLPGKFPFSVKSLKRLSAFYVEYFMHKSLIGKIIGLLITFLFLQVVTPVAPLSQQVCNHVFVFL